MSGLSCLLAGLPDLTEQFVRRFEQQAASAALQLKQAAHAGTSALYQEAVHIAQRFEHLSGRSICTSHHASFPQGGSRIEWYCEPAINSRAAVHSSVCGTAAQTMMSASSAAELLLIPTHEHDLNLS